MADAHGSGPCVGNNMRVQVPSSALIFFFFRMPVIDCWHPFLYVKMFIYVTHADNSTLNVFPLFKVMEVRDAEKDE